MLALRWLALGLALGVLGAFFWDASPDGPRAPCVCGHDHAAHCHNRRGTDCALCPKTGPDACRAYEPTRLPPPPKPSSMLDLLELHAQQRDLAHAIARREARTDAALGRVPAL